MPHQKIARSYLDFFYTDENGRRWRGTVCAQCDGSGVAGPDLYGDAAADCVWCDGTGDEHHPTTG